MLVLFDNGTPRGLARFLIGHCAEEARARGWEELANGDLIAAAGAQSQTVSQTGQPGRYTKTFADTVKNSASSLAWALLIPRFPLITSDT